MANLTTQEKASLSTIEREMARKGFDLGKLLDSKLPIKLTSAASSGGAAAETLAVVGLLATDELLAVTQRVEGALDAALIGYVLDTNAEIDLTWDTDPGAGAIVEVLIRRG